MGPRQRLLQRLRRDRGALAGAVILLILLGVAALAEPLAPYRYDTQFREWPYHPPMLGAVRFTDPVSGWPCWPWVGGLAGAKGTDLAGSLEEQPVQVQVQVQVQDASPTAMPEQRFPLVVLGRGEPYVWLGLVPAERHLLGVASGGHLFLLGTDGVGRDLLSRMLYGTRVSLLVSLGGILLTMALGLLVGGLAGYRGGWLDFFLMRLVELVLALPGLYLLLVVRDAFGRELESLHLYLAIILVLALVEWAPHARVVRGMVLALRRQEYVAAARVQGFAGLSILVRQILPGTFSYVIVGATLSLPYFVVGEVALSFLGLGVQEPHASWGLMLRDAQSVRVLRDFPWLLLPGLGLFLTVLAANLLGEGLRDAVEVRQG